MQNDMVSGKEYDSIYNKYTRDIPSINVKSIKAMDIGYQRYGNG